MSKPLPLSVRRTIKGKRPAFHDNASIDRLIAMTLTMASEIAALRERVDTLERLGQSHGWLKDGAVDAYFPSPDVKAAREKWREDYISRVFYIMREEIADLEKGETDAAYWATIAAVETGDGSVASKTKDAAKAPAKRAAPAVKKAPKRKKS